jgi:glycine amidinotransferase
MKSVVNSFNEWDPLEEIIVGVLEGASNPPLEIGHIATLPADLFELAREPDFRAWVQATGKPRQLTTDPDAYAAAQAALDGFVRVLEAAGVTVRRPDPIDHARPYTTLDWSCAAGTGQSVPRDVLIVIGDELLEAPMSWRSRYYEHLPYRRLIREYFRQGARWTAAPKPQMTDELYDHGYQRGKGWVTTEHEPVFDAADIARFGKDLFVQRSHVTNQSGIEWLRRHLGPTYNVHAVEFADARAMHIDATFVPLAPGKLLVNPERPIKQMPPMFERAGWQILVAPPTAVPRTEGGENIYRWLHMNVLSLDEKRVIVEQDEVPLIRALEGWGFEPIPCSFRAFYPYGGSFHCATCDVRRRGELQSYF